MNQSSLFDHLRRNQEPTERTSGSWQPWCGLHVRTVNLGAASVVALTVADPANARTPTLMRAPDPDVYGVLIPLGGRISVARGGRATELAPGAMALYRGGRPFEAHLVEHDRPASIVRAQVARGLLTPAPDQLDRLLESPIPSAGGVGGILARFVQGLTAEPFGNDGDTPGESTQPGTAQAGSLVPADLPRLGNLMVDMFEAVLAHELDRDVPVALPTTALRNRIISFMREHLGEPTLSPDSVATAHHISVSYLHRLFEGRQLTVAAWIRQQRLDRARRDLADPTLAALPISRIAYRWGFRDHATFTRAFRGTFETSPRAYRRALLCGSGAVRCESGTHSLVVSTG